MEKSKEQTKRTNKAEHEISHNYLASRTSIYRAVWLLQRRNEHFFKKTNFIFYPMKMGSIKTGINAVVKGNNDVTFVRETKKFKCFKRTKDEKNLLRYIE